MKEQIERLIDLNFKRRKLDASIKSIESELSDSFEVDLDKSKTLEVEGYKVVVKRPAYYKLDLNVYDEIKKQIPPKMRAIKTKTELDKIGYKWLMTNEPEVFEVMAKAVTVTAGKPSIEIKE
ncbi:conserved hypothetical protein [uncultured Thiomicrorhabdus sp.]